MGYFTCYKEYEELKRTNYSQVFKPMACYSSIFQIRNEKNNVYLLAIPMVSSISGYSVSTKIKEKDIRSYLSILKRHFGGIVRYSFHDLKYKYGYKGDGLSKKSVVIVVDRRKIKLRNKQYGLKYLLTMIRYISETPYSGFLKKAIINHKKYPKISLLTHLLSSHKNNSYGQGHSFCTYDINNVFRKFDIKKVPYNYMCVNDGYLYMDEITNKNTIKLLNELYGES